MEFKIRTSLRQFYTFLLQLLSAKCITILLFGGSAAPSAVRGESDEIALLALKSMISTDPDGALRSWNGSLHFCKWHGVICSDQHPPRVTSLNLTGQSLVGSLSPHISNLSFLSSIDLSSNSIQGHIPQEIGHLLTLRFLNLSANSLDGEIPKNLTLCKELRVLDLYDNKLYGRIPSELSSLTRLRRLMLHRNNFVGSIPPSIGNLSSVSHLDLSVNSLEGSIPSDLGRMVNLNVLIFRRNNLSGESIVGESFLEVTYSMLFKATDGFSSANLIGVGSYGSVYRGVLEHNDMVVAIKVLKLQERRGSRCFIAECEALRGILHRNIIKILTVCSSIDSRGNDFKALVFQYMPSGSLDSWLHPNENEQFRNLNLFQRINIAIDVACALDYLHHHCHEPIVHCDLKPSNILLDEALVAHVGDFGLARILHKKLVAHSQTQPSWGLKGSIGYVAPEYGMAGNVTTSGDVYSYGILLLEMITGKKPTDEMFRDNQNLHQLAKVAFPERVLEITDHKFLQIEVETIRFSEDISKIHECLISLVRISLSCCAESPKERMKMNEVVAELHGVRDFYFDIRIIYPSSIRLVG